MGRVVIIGGGPAGSSAGVHLARQGFDVTIIEAKAFPRVKVCGEFVSPAATGLLESLLDPADLRAAGAQRVRTLVLERGERTAEWRMPAEAWAISRAMLDLMLLDRARTAGCRVLQPSRVEGVEYNEDGVRVRMVDGPSLAADVVVHADGRGALDAGPARPTRHRVGVVAFKCHLRRPGGVSGIRMRAAAGAYVGLVQVEGGLATCALVARQDLVRSHRGNADGMLRSLWPGFDPAWRIGAWLASGVASSGYTPPGHMRSFRIGNATAAVEPLGGEGIGLALWSGSVLAQVLDDPRSAQSLDRLRSAQREFARAYRSRLRLRRPACRLAATALMNSHAGAALWPLATIPELFIRPWYGLTGKPLRTG